jgi:hypothetical protein
MGRNDSDGRDSDESDAALAAVAAQQRGRGLWGVGGLWLRAGWGPRGGHGRETGLEYGGLLPGDVVAVRSALSSASFSYDVFCSPLLWPFSRPCVFLLWLFSLPSSGILLSSPLAFLSPLHLSPLAFLSPLLSRFSPFASQRRGTWRAWLGGDTDEIMSARTPMLLRCSTCTCGAEM